MVRRKIIPDRESYTVRDLIFYQYVKKYFTKAILGPDVKNKAYGIVIYVMELLIGNGIGRRDKTSLNVFDLNLT